MKFSPLSRAAPCSNRSLFEQRLKEKKVVGYFWFYVLMIKLPLITFRDPARRWDESMTSRLNLYYYNFTSLFGKAMLEVSITILRT